MEAVYICLLYFSIKGGFLFFFYLSVTHTSWKAYQEKAGRQESALFSSSSNSHEHEGHNVLAASRMASPPQGGRTGQEPLASKSLPECVFVFLKIF